jgi:alpha-galactosidase
MPDEIRAILTAPELVAVDQDPLGVQGDLLRAEDGAEVWARELADGSRVVVLFDSADESREIAVRWTDIGWEAKDRVQVRDLWERADVGTMAEGYAVRVPPHGTAMLRVTSSD